MLVALVAGICLTTLLIALAGHARVGSREADLLVSHAFDQVGAPDRDAVRPGAPRHPEFVEFAAKLKTIV
ncbi:hypothetical protein QSJ19_22840 [Gordonia sp. ABSL11-1]|uniref:hypothetical protein n=1 Tax=Gordonia sp. ABSL11-1 TaxID=3053924 RepID=UPI0025735170|nr:hypothetical protein [Gordonia sp. ABSL11-1]MDL9948362.1 hypothetical protein [Gordonia sp. ABSL11-1]